MLFSGKINKISVLRLLRSDPIEGEYSTRIRRDRANKQKSCVHKISCYNGDHLQLEQMKIMPNCKIFFFNIFLGLNFIFRSKSTSFGSSATFEFQRIEKTISCFKTKKFYDFTCLHVRKCFQPKMSRKIVSTTAVAAENA